MLKSLDKLTSTKLKKLCHDEHISGYSHLKKKQLLQFIKTHKLNLLVKEGIEQLLALD